MPRQRQNPPLPPRAVLVYTEQCALPGRDEDVDLSHEDVTA